MTIDIIKRASLTKQFVNTNLSIFLLTGCSISVPQVESSYSFVRDLISSEHASSEDQQVIWLGAVDNRGAVLRPYLSGGLTVFANTDGDAIAFDGWTIRSIVGFGLAVPLSISGKDGTRTFSTGALTTSTECDSWHLDGLIWSQSCENGDGQIVLNEDGNIELILMSLGENLGIVTLKVAK